ncbi:hypothetical protein [Sphingomonas sp. DC1100-1]|uniref:hypothetical protein n=1 Tax=unclassified Sphingomonas TaxID=196159 RepID=UPI003CF337DF
MTRVSATTRSVQTLPMLALLATSASAILPPSREQAVMDAIERSIVLPQKAWPFAAYGRNYAWSDTTHVVATYILPSLPSDPREGCDLLTDDFKTRPCTPEKNAEMDRQETQFLTAETPAGNRRWFAQPIDLPSIDDGGCIQVTVQYDVVSRSITRAQCNGYA